MTELLTTLGPHAPALVVLVFIVVLFLRYLSHRDEIIKEVSDACHVHQTQGYEIQKETRDALRENSRVVGEVIEVIRNCNGRNVGRERR